MTLSSSRRIQMVREQSINQSIKQSITFLLPDTHESNGLFNFTTVPAAPTQPLVTDSTDSTMSLLWSRIPSPTNRSPVSVYLVECASLDGSTQPTQLTMLIGVGASTNSTSTATTNATAPSSYGGLKFVRYGTFFLTHSGI